MAENPTERVFRAQLRWYLLVMIGVGVGATLSTAILVFRLSAEISKVPPDAVHMAKPEGFVLPLGVVAVLWGLIAVEIASIGLTMIQGARKAYVAVDAEGLTSVNWRGNADTVPWGSVDSLQVIHYTNPLLTIIVDRRKTRLPSMIPDQEELAKEIIAHAGLEKVSENWWRTVYARRSEG